MSEDIGDDDRVVVLGRGLVDGREPAASLRGVACCGEEEGRTADIDERDCMKRVMFVSSEVSLPDGCLISNVVLESASFWKSFGKAGTGGGAAASREYLSRNPP